MNKTTQHVALLAASTLLSGWMSTAMAGHTNAILETRLDGREEVDSSDPTNRLAGDPDGVGEAYVFGIDNDATTLCYTLFVEDIQLVPVGEGMAAHIHEGVRDQNGPVVAVLAGPEDGNAADCLTEGESGKFPTEEAGIVQRILTNPSDFYINVHNPEFPGGAVRGQLMAVEDEHDDHKHEVNIMLYATPDRTDAGDYGWVIFSDNTKQWVDGDCRSIIQAEGVSVESKEWTEISMVPDSITYRECATIIDMIDS